MINRATSQLYPPGSTFKTIVAATALESGDYDTDTQIPAGASYTLPGTSTNLTNTTAAANGIDSKITLQDALTYSSNTAFAQLGVKLGQTNVVVCVSSRSSSVHVSRLIGSVTPSSATWDEAGTALDAGCWRGAGAAAGRQCDTRSQNSQNLIFQVHKNTFFLDAVDLFRYNKNDSKTHSISR